jgi:hypothetical protein
MLGVRRYGHAAKGARGLIGLALLFALVMGGLAASVATRADAAPSSVIGPEETFTGTVVAGTVVPAGAVVRFNVERPSKTNPAELEQIVVESAQAALAVPNQILSITGNYDTDQKVFKATSMTSLGNPNPVRATASGTTTTDDDDEDNDNNLSNSHDDNDNS